MATRRLPTVDELVRDVAELRRVGLTRIRTVQVPAMERVATVVVGEDSPSAIERVLRQAVLNLGGGDFGQAGELLFGFAQGTRGRKPPELRRLAAAVFDVQPDTFRKDREKQIVQAIAGQLLGIAVHNSLQGTAAVGDAASADRVARIVEDIAALSAAELGQLVPLLAARLNVPQREVWRRREPG